MPLLDQSFEWPVDDVGYAIVNRKPKPPKGRAAPRVSTLLSAERGGPNIVRKGGRLRTTRPLELHSTLFVDFARLDGTDRSCLRFANTFGYLGLFPNEADDRVGER